MMIMTSGITSNLKQFSFRWFSRYCQKLPDLFVLQLNIHVSRQFLEKGLNLDSLSNDRKEGGMLLYKCNPFE
jgi:hypothetical protein